MLHIRGEGFGPGKYPVKVAQKFLGVLQSAEEAFEESDSAAGHVVEFYKLEDVRPVRYALGHDFIDDNFHSRGSTTIIGRAGRAQVSSAVWR